MSVSIFAAALHPQLFALARGALVLGIDIWSLQPYLQPVEGEPAPKEASALKSLEIEESSPSVDPNSSAKDSPSEEPHTEPKREDAKFDKKKEKEREKEQKKKEKEEKKEREKLAKQKSKLASSAVSAPAQADPSMLSSPGHNNQQIQAMQVQQNPPPIPPKPKSLQNSARGLPFFVLPFGVLHRLVPQINFYLAASSVALSSLNAVAHLVGLILSLKRERAFAQLSSSSLRSAAEATLKSLDLPFAYLSSLATKSHWAAIAIGGLQLMSYLHDGKANSFWTPALTQLASASTFASIGIISSSWNVKK